MRARGWMAVVTSATVLACCGCGWRGGAPATTAGAVAVIDLDEVAQRLGSDKKISDAIAQRQSTLRQQLTALAKSYTEQIAEQRKTLAPADEQQSQVTVAAWEQQASANLNQVKQRAELDLQNHRAQLVVQFRDQVKPVARRVAQRRGLSVIVTKNDSVLYDYVSSVDITDEVIDELMAGSAAAPATPAAAVPQTATAGPAAPQR